MIEAPGDLASVVADIAGRLPAGHVTAWAAVLRSVPSGRTVSIPALEARLIEARPGFAMAGAVSRLIAAWQAADPPASGPAVALALESAAYVAARAEARRGEVVISGPASDSAAVRLTSSVISELVRDCRESLLVVSFAAFGVPEVVTELGKAARRGVRIDLILESTADRGCRIAVRQSVSTSNPHPEYGWMSGSGN